MSLYRSGRPVFGRCLRNVEFLLSDHIEDLDGHELYISIRGGFEVVTLSQDASCGQQRGLYNQNIGVRHIAEENTLGESVGYLD